MNKKFDILKNTNMNEYSKYINQTNSNFLLKINSDNLIFDTVWVDKFEEILPFLDNIIRNPRRFIIQEEDIVPIEKTKKVTEESIKHLAQHTNLIQHIDEEGFAKPSKLLNVYKEETFDLYENRFIYSLIKNLYVFIQRVLKVENYDSIAKIKKEASYVGETKIDGEKINFNLSVEINKKENINANINNDLPLSERIENLKKVIYDFMASPFIKSLAQATPVKSPIRKTNVFLKEPNFKKALELWEFLEKYQNMDLTKTEKEYNEEMDVNKKNNFDLLSYISYNIISGNISEKIDVPTIEDDYLYKFIEDYVLENDASEKEFKNYINKQYKQALIVKKRREKELIQSFDKIISRYKARKEKAINILN